MGIKKNKLLFKLILILYSIIIFNSTIYAENVDQNIITETIPAQKTSDGTIIPPTVVAEAALLIDINTGDILYEKNIHKKLYPASTTKIMTTLIALENTQLDEIVEFSDNAINGIDPESSVVGMKVGEQLTVKDAIYGMLVKSGNEVCVGIAEKISGTEEEFCKKMTERAHELGAVNTNFVNAHGLHDENHYTTAYDLSLIFKEALKYDIFRKAIKTAQYNIPPTNKTPEEITIINSNRMILSSTSYYYDYCEGGKTGYTDEAKNTLITLGKKNGMELIAVVLKEPQGITYTDTKALYEYGFNYFTNKVIFDSSTFEKTVPAVQNEKEDTFPLGYVKLVADSDYIVTLREDVDDSSFAFTETLPDSVSPPLSRGDVVGTIDIYHSGEVNGTIDVKAGRSVIPLSVDEIRQTKFDNFVETQKELAPIYLAFIPAALIIIYFIVKLVKKLRGKSKRSPFSNNVRYRMRSK